MDDAALAPVLDNSLGWGAFMATSANVRYQAINAFEERFLVRHVTALVRCLQARWQYATRHQGKGAMTCGLQTVIRFLYVLFHSMLWPSIMLEE